MQSSFFIAYCPELSLFRVENPIENNFELLSFGPASGGKLKFTEYILDSQFQTISYSNSNNIFFLQNATFGLMERRAACSTKYNRALARPCQYIYPVVQTSLLEVNLRNSLNPSITSMVTF